MSSEKRLIVVLARTVYLPGFLMFVGYGMVAPVVPLYATALGGSLAVAGAVVSLRGFGQLLINLPAGMLLSRIGNRRLLLLSTIGALLAALATGLSRSIALLSLCTFLAGGLRSTWAITRVDYIRDLVAPGQRGRAISAVGGTIRVGGFLGPIIGGFVAKSFGYPATFLAQSALVAVAFLLYLFPGKKNPLSVTPQPGRTGRSAQPAPEAVSAAAPEVESRTPRKSSPLAEIGAVFKNQRRSFLTVGLVAFGFSVVRSARQAIFPLWGDAISLDVVAIGLVVGLSSGLDMLLFAPAGMVMDRYGRKWTGVPSLAVMSVSLLLLPLSRGFAALLAVGLAIGFGNGLGAGIVMTLGADLAPEKNTGAFLGLWFLTAGIGSTVGPLIIGGLADVLSLGTASIVTGWIGLAAVVYFLFFVPETHRPRR